jgi:hypothetical protein
MSDSEVARWAKKAREATERRNQAIKEAYDEGATLREIAAAAGLSHTAIAKIIAKTHTSSS